MRTVFVHSRNGPNASHGAYARSIDATWLPVDFVLPWEDRPSSRLRRYASWALSTVLFPRRRTYDVFLTDGPQFPLALMRRVGLIRRPQRLMAIMGDDTLYFLRTDQFSRVASAAIRRTLESYDALLCVGEMTSSIARELLGSGRGRPQVFTVHPVWESAARLAAGEAEPDLEGNTLVFVGHGPSARRGWYKGLDLLVHAFSLVLGKVPAARLTVAGQWDPSYTGGLPLLPDVGHAVSFVGPVPDVMASLRSASLYVHLGRGEAFGMSVLEAMAAGVPCVVSEWTGAREAVRQVDPTLVVPLDATAAADRILWYLALPADEKRRLSRRSREVAATFSDERALAGFREAFTTAARG